MLNVDTNKDADDKSSSPNYPWWEPYVFTAGVFVAFAVLLIVFGQIARIPFVEHLFLALMTLAATFEAIRRPSTTPSFVGGILYSTFFGLASYAYLSKGETFLGLGYAVLSIVWLCLVVNASAVRRRIRAERSAKLDRVVETLRAAAQRDVED